MTQKLAAIPPCDLCGTVRNKDTPDGMCGRCRLRISSSRGRAAMTRTCTGCGWRRTANNGRVCVECLGRILPLLAGIDCMGW